jgi:sugar phosphate isomerase/epimerase
LDEVLALAVKHGADLVELRIADDEPVHIGLSGTERAAVKRRFAEAGVAFGALATYVKLSDPGLAGPLAAHVELAADLGAPALRLFPGDVAPADGVRRLSDGLESARGSGVALTVETHDEYIRADRLAPILSELDGRVGAVWDVMHTWRGGEAVPESLAALRPYLAELQIKDIPSAADRRPIAPGTGVLPLREALDAAWAAGFDGPVVFEHEAKWRADAQPFEECLVAALELSAR